MLVRSLRRLGGELGLYPSPKRLGRTEHDAVESTPKTKSVVLYDWDTDPRQRDLNVLIVTVAAFLRSQRVAHNASDVWLVTLDFAVPIEAGCMDPEEMVANQPHCPEDLIRQVIAVRGGA
jgi:hypothetical protein